MRANQQVRFGVVRGDIDTDISVQHNARGRSVILYAAGVQPILNQSSSYAYAVAACSGSALAWDSGTVSVLLGGWTGLLTELWTSAPDKWWPGGTTGYAPGSAPPGDVSGSDVAFYAATLYGSGPPQPPAPPPGPPPPPPQPPAPPPGAPPQPGTAVWLGPMPPTPPPHRPRAKVLFPQCCQSAGSWSWIPYIAQSGNSTCTTDGVGCPNPLWLQTDCTWNNDPSSVVRWFTINNGPLPKLVPLMAPLSSDRAVVAVSRDTALIVFMPVPAVAPPMTAMWTVLVGSPFAADVVSLISNTANVTISVETGSGPQGRITTSASSGVTTTYSFYTNVRAGWVLWVLSVDITSMRLYEDGLPVTFFSSQVGPPCRPGKYLFCVCPWKVSYLLVRRTAGLAVDNRGSVDAGILGMGTGIVQVASAFHRSYCGGPDSVL